jgi:hypothetical protein
MKWCFLVLLVSSIGFSVSFGQDSGWIDPLDDEFFFVDEAQLDSGGVFAFLGIYFALVSDHLLDTANSKFNREFDIQIMHSNETRLLGLANYMFRRPTYIFELGVHRDCKGSDASSRRLTPRRSQTIVDELTRLGIAEGRLIAKGFGESQSYTYNGILLTCEYITRFSKIERDALHQKNRRIQLKVLSKDYVP